MAQPTPTTPRNNPSHSELHNFHVNVKMFGATGDGTTDDTTACTSAITAAGIGGRVYFPAGTYRVGSLAPLSMQVWEGVGFLSFLKAKTSATEVVSMVGLIHCELQNLTIDGNAQASKGVVVISSATVGSQGHLFSKCRFQNCTTGVSIEQGTVQQADKNTYLSCQWNDNTTGLKINSVNGQNQLLLGVTFDSHTTAIELTAGTLNWIGGQVQTATTGLLINGANVQWCRLTDVLMEGETTSINATFVPNQKALILENCILQGSTNTLNASANSFKMIARGCQFNNGAILFSGSDAVFIDEFNVKNSTLTMSGANPHRYGWADFNGLELNGVAGASDGVRFGAAGGTTQDTNLYRAGANIIQTDDVLRDHKGTPAYSASITPVATDGDWQTITATNGTAFTINAPTSAPDSTHSQELTIEIFNNSGGVLGAVTWNAAFVLVGGAFTNPANTKKRFIAFKWNGSSWIETSRATADY